MLSDEVSHAVDELLAEVRARPSQFPIAELTAVQQSGHDVKIDFRRDDTVVMIAPRPDERLTVLTRRERDVALLVATGYSNQQIATALFISVATVKDHMHSILSRTGLSSRGQLIAAWYGGLDGQT